MGILSPLLKKLLNPIAVYRIIKLQRNRKKVERVRDDAQLKLYSQILKGDFLHYGYFDDPTIKPEDISLTVPGGKVTANGDGKFTVSINKTGRVLAEIYNTKKDKLIGTANFEVYVK